MGRWYYLLFACSAYSFHCEEQPRKGEQNCRRSVTQLVFPLLTLSQSNFGEGEIACELCMIWHDFQFQYPPSCIWSRHLALHPAKSYPGKQARVATIKDSELRFVSVSRLCECRINSRYFYCVTCIAGGGGDSFLDHFKFGSEKNEQASNKNRWWCEFEMMDRLSWIKDLVPLKVDNNKKCDCRRPKTNLLQLVWG